jgi:hypothetical protein
MKMAPFLLRSLPWWGIRLSSQFCLEVEMASRSEEGVLLGLFNCVEETDVEVG